MKAFNKNQAKRNIDLKQNKNTYIKRLSISLSCLFLLLCAILLTFAKYETSSDVYTMINGHVNFCYAGKTWDFSYTANYEEFKVPCDGKYKIELWGSAGYEDDTRIAPGKGGYTAGNITFNRNEKIYVYVGSNRVLGSNYTFNGGGSGEAAGGGATDIRLVSGSWDNFESLKSRIMVAAGGGGAFHGPTTTDHVPGHGGGLNGYDADCTYRGSSMKSTGRSGRGASQTSYGPTNTVTSSNSYSTFITDGYHSVAAGFGYGGYGTTNQNVHYSSGGGSGYYGGSHGIHPGSSWTGGGGGSSFISGYSGCKAITSTSTASNIVHTSSANHYSGKVFTNGVMIDGKGCNWSSGSAASCGANQPQPTGSNTAGHSGAGYAKITFVSK